MHDLPEGVAQHEIELLSGYLKQNVSENDLLLRIYSFDYGFLECKKPPQRLFWRVLVIALV